ncbi:hypothetical protein [Sorangium sp. So ce1000]|uniref:hypothetical protein n=1 Tax=Sorangium sp. So ce1000 TaxID=3133325 RepID=UPI003F62FBC9
MKPPVTAEAARGESGAPPLPLELDCVSLYVPEDDPEAVMLTAKPGSVSAALLRALSAT